jgi:type II secretory ATPase GspE/PulE/Tfp pilus assembly ATPase PilB-like protein
MFNKLIGGKNNKNSKEVKQNKNASTSQSSSLKKPENRKTVNGKKKLQNNKSDKPIKNTSNQDITKKHEGKKISKSASSFGATELTKVSPNKVFRLEANESQVKELLAYQGEVLTSGKGDIPVTEAQKQVAAILDNGTMIVSKGDPLNPNVVSLKTLAKRMGVKIIRELTVDLDVIRKVYENSDRREGGEERGNDAAKMQRDFIELLRQAAVERASDIHVLLHRFEAIVKIRADGVMRTFKQLPADYASDLLAASFAMADASDPSYKPYDYQGARISETTAALPVGIQAVRLQFNPLPNGGRYLIARLLYAQASETGKDIDALGYSDVHIRDIKRMRRKPFGINIISGPTGSGKSTTLQVALTALMEAKRFQVNVITIEDPPEYVISGAAQLPVTNAETDEERNEKFRQAISASLRSDPDIIMIGEIRDKASSTLAFAAAMTGHQVWASLHSNDAISILDRFRDQGIELYKLADYTLITGLVGQRLLRALCPHCKLPLNDVLAFEDNRLIDEDIVNGLYQKIGEEHFEHIYVANENGCDECKKGYAGRTVVAECINPDPGFMKFIIENDKMGAYNYWLENLDGLNMLEHAVQKMLMGVADPRDVEDRVGMLSDFNLDRKKHVFSQVGINIETKNEEK